MSQLKAFTMPKWGIEMTEGTLAEWMVAEGEAFAKGQVLASIETDKIINDVEADYASVCLRRVVEAAKDYPVGALLAVFGDAGTSSEDIDAFVADFGSSASAATSQEQEAAAPVQTAQATEVSDKAAKAPEGMRISLKALHLAQENGIDLTQLAGSGGDARISLQDVEQAIKNRT